LNQSIFYHEFEGNPKYDQIVIVMPGSTQLAYDKNHVLIKKLIISFSKVYSLDLPGHGKMAIKSENILNFNDEFEKLSKALIPIITDQNVCFVGYSIGGLIGIKLQSILTRFSQNYTGIYIGSGLRISEVAAPRIQNFFSEGSFQAFGWKDLMERDHGKYWRYLLKTLTEWLKPNSYLHPNDHELEKITRESHFFILAKKDQSFKIDDIRYAFQTHNREPRIYEVKGDHFTYFHEKVGWEDTKASLDKIFIKSEF
jgi:hypothetical protein